MNQIIVTEDVVKILTPPTNAKIHYSLIIISND